MRTLDDSGLPQPTPTARDGAEQVPGAMHTAPARGRAARAGLPTIPLPQDSARATVATSVRSHGSPGSHAVTGAPGSGSPHASTSERARVTGTQRRRVVATVPAAASTGVADVLRGPVRTGRVLLSLPAAVYVQVTTERGTEIVGVLTSDAARLPLGCVISRPANGRPLVSVPAGAPATIGAGRIVVGDLVVSAAAWWDPRPRLPSAQPALLPEGVRELRTALYGEGAAPSSFALAGLPMGPSGPLAALRGAVRRADLDAALRTAVRLVGLGPGLTPAGDDVLAGMVAGLVLLGHPEAERFGTAVHALAAGRTTELSRALLRHSAGGRVSAEYAAVLRGLVGDGALAPALAGLLATGSTSGRALALGLSTAIDFVDRGQRAR